MGNYRQNRPLVTKHAQEKKKLNNNNVFFILVL